MCGHGILVIAFCLSANLANAQKILSEQEAIDLALINSPQLKVADLQLKQSKARQKTGINLPNPEVLAESPTGDFYAIGVLQSVDFPTTYWKLNQLLKQQRILSEKGKTLTIQEVKRLVKIAYLNAGIAQALAKQLFIQDSLYAQLASTAVRQFDAGQIDYLVKSFAQVQYGDVHNQYLQAQQAFDQTKHQLQLYTSIKDTFDVSPVQIPVSNHLDTSSWQQNPSLQLFKQNETVNQKALSVERHRALPGLIFGYLNQGDRNTETYYRFRVGFTLPLWFWQYSGNIKAAKAGVEIAEQQTIAQHQLLTIELHQAMGELANAQKGLEYFASGGLKQADDIIDAAKRFFAIGSTDYTTLIRTINEAYSIKSRYIQTLQRYHNANITINYLTGNL